MANPTAVTEGGGLKLPLITDSDGSPRLARAFGDETLSGFTDKAGATAVAGWPAAVHDAAHAANGSAVATMPAVASKRNYLCGFAITGSGATSAAVVRATFAGLPDTFAITIAVPAGANLGIAPIIVTLPNPIPASAENTAIALTVPAFGSGNTDVDVSVWGFVSA